MRALILAAGRGTRLGQLTEAVPKPLLQAGGRPILGWIIANLVRCGVRRVAVNLCYRGEDIAAWLGDGRRHRLDELVLSHEPEPLGTAGALRPLAGWLGQGPFLVHYGDVVCDHDLAALEADRAAHGALATILLHRRSGSNSLVELAADGQVRAFRERPPVADIAQAGEVWVNSGIYACAPALLGLIPASGPSDLPRDLFVAEAARGTLRGQPLAGYRLAVDSPQRLQRLEDDLRNGALAGLGTTSAFVSPAQAPDAKSDATAVLAAKPHPLP